MIHELDLIYHSSYREIEYPSIKKSKFTKDFSWGLYCDTNKNVAEKKSELFNTGTVNVYKINNIKNLNIKIFKEYNEEWLDFIIKCRSGNIHNYDIVLGPIADDSIYDYIESYYKNQMNKSYFLKEMKEKYDNNMQVSLHTIKALKSISFLESYLK